MRSALRSYGPFAIALWMLGATRWGSYIVPGPPYIGDIVIGLIVAERVLALFRSEAAAERMDSWLALTCGALLTWTGVRLLLSSPIDVNSFRDAAPYLYAVLVFATPPPESRTATRKANVLIGALIFHAAWFTVAKLAPSFVAQLPKVSGGGLPIFGTRPDIDGTVCGLAAVLFINRAVNGRNPGLSIALAAWNLVLPLSSGNRAGLLAVLVQLLAMVLLAPVRRRIVRRLAPRVVAIAVLIVVPLLIVEAQHSPTIKRFVSGMSVYLPFVSHGHTNVGGAAGTASARRQSWRVLEHWLQQNGSRNYFGVGFGPDFLHDSGADIPLLGGDNADVRSPHNYFLGTWARLGLVGLVLLLLLMAAALRLILVVTSAAYPVDELDLAAVLIVIGVPVAAAVGVILESPFGAVPWFWAFGHLSQRAVQLGVAAPWDRAPAPAEAGAQGRYERRQVTWSR